MTTITISDELYKGLERSAKENNMLPHSFILQALNAVVNKTKPKTRHKYQLKVVEELPKEIQDVIGIAKGAHIKDGDLNGREARMEYLSEKYGK